MRTGSDDTLSENTTERKKDQSYFQVWQIYNYSKILMVLWYNPLSKFCFTKIYQLLIVHNSVNVLLTTPLPRHLRYLVKIDIYVLSLKSLIPEVWSNILNKSCQTIWEPKICRIAVEGRLRQKLWPPISTDKKLDNEAYANHPSLGKIGGSQYTPPGINAIWKILEIKGVGGMAQVTEFPQTYRIWKLGRFTQGSWKSRNWLPWF
jgi:hypothetical protein